MTRRKTPVWHVLLLGTCCLACVALLAARCISASAAGAANVLDAGTAIVRSLCAVALLAVALSDLRARIIPDSLVTIIAALALCDIVLQICDGWATAVPAAGAASSASAPLANASPWGAALSFAGERLAGGLVISLPVLLLALAVERFRGGQAMGGGDIKLLFAAGLFFGPEASLFGLLLACLLAVIGSIPGIIRRRRQGKQGADPLPFGVAIAFAWWLLLAV